METSFSSVFVERYIQFGAGPVLNYSYLFLLFIIRFLLFSYFFLETIPTFFLLFHQRPLSSLHKGIISSLEPKAHGELIVYQTSRRPSVHACVRLFTLSNMIISTTSRPIPTKFYPKHHLGGGKAALGFWPDRIGTLVSMATDSSHKVIMGKILLAL